MKSFIPDSLTYVEGNTIPITEIRRRFTDSEHGKKLNQQLRWKPAKTEGTTDDQWRKTFGADVNNLLHLDLSYGFVRAFLRKIKKCEELTMEDAEIFLLTSQTHDWQEAITDDKSAIYKTEDDETLEMNILRKMLNDYIPEDKASKSPKIPRVISTLTDKETLLYRMFNAIEKIGYLRTAKRAYLVKDVYSTDQFSPHQRESWHAMACQPFITNAPDVMTYCEEFPELAEFFTNPRVRPLWQSILDDCDNVDFEKFYPKKGRGLEANIPAVRKQWADFMAKHSTS